jgi:carboxypeptidase PM20D1
MVKRFLALVGLGLVALAGVLVVRTLAVHPAPPPTAARPESGVNAQEASAHLAEAVRFRTISHQDPAEDDATQFDDFHNFLAVAYPRVHAQLQREQFGGGSLLFTWRGADASLRPLLLLAHQDVVPVDLGSDAQWSHPPFAGVVADGFVWGRGTLDDKGSLVALLEAIEQLLREGFVPQRTVLLAFGHDEEVSGLRGARELARVLASRGVTPEMVLDEGLLVAEGIVPGVNKPVALIGVAEKGYLSLELTTQAKGGHSSMPPPQTAVGILAAAVDRLEAHPFPTHLTGPLRSFAAALAPGVPFFQRLALANLWLFGPVLQRVFARVPSTNAMVRTTLATTMFRAGTKDNVLPQQASAVVNLRLLPGDSVASATRRVTEVVADPRVRVTPFTASANEPSPVSSVTSTSFGGLERSVREVFPDALVAPSLVLGATDSRHYARLGADTYRFVPLRFGPSDLERVHGTNERLSVKGMGEAVRFYRQLVRDVAGAEPTKGGSG